MNERTRLLRSLIRLDGLGLEIGPGYNPLVPKSEGFRVETVDYTDADGLRAKYTGNPHVDLNRIEMVDHVLDGTKSLEQAIDRPGSFDYIIASHVIEHTPDMLGFLQSCQILLSPGGVLLLAVPDKRHCFDVFQPLSSTGVVLQAHLDRRIRPMPGAIFDDLAYNAVRGEAIGWLEDDTRDLRFFASLMDAKNAFHAARQSNGYQDVHVWRFVPSSFRLIIRDLCEIGEIDMKECYFHRSVGNEFYIALSRTGPGCTVDRLTLARQALLEHATIKV